MNAAGGMLLGSLLLRLLLLLLLHGGQANGSGKVHVGCGLLVSGAGGRGGDGIAVRSVCDVVLVVVMLCSDSWSKFGSKRQWQAPVDKDRFCQRRVDAGDSSELGRAKERWKGRSRADSAKQMGNEKRR